jgi:cellulose synthase/poly-beta-1,6-N-acetylglucosamine synthase-like glycosyltransferase
VTPTEYGETMKFGDCGHDLSIRRNDKGQSFPKVTVILPTFARANGLLQLSIESVLSQSYGDFELIVVDDGSRDGTADVLNEYQLADSRIAIHSYTYNSGLPALRVNQAAFHGRGNPFQALCMAAVTHIARRTTARYFSVYWGRSSTMASFSMAIISQITQ